MMSDVVRGDLPHNPYIKSLLRHYQESAERSLEGPALTDVVKLEEVRTDGAMMETSFYEGRRAGTMPTNAATLSRLRGDPHRRVVTTLEGERISCFVVGGERRLCVPQMLNTMLSQFSLSEIHSACDSLRIHIALADDRQTAILKRDNILPPTAHGCGLMTLTDSQRLCGVLLGEIRGTLPFSAMVEPEDSIPVMHRCFGKCVGSLRPSTRVVRCSYCRHEFDVEQFVCHSHGDQESCTCHWGFDAANWRLYLQLAPDVADDERLQDCLDCFKYPADFKMSHSRKRHEVPYSDLGHCADVIIIILF